MNYVHCIVLVLFPEMLQYPDLLLGLPVEALLIANHLQSNMLMRFVIVRLHYLTKTPLPNHFEHLVTVRDVIVRYVNIRSLFVVVFTVVRVADPARSLLCIHTNEIHLRIIVNF